MHDEQNQLLPPNVTCQALTFPHNLFTFSILYQFLFEDSLLLLGHIQLSNFLNTLLDVLNKKGLYMYIPTSISINYVTSQVQLHNRVTYTLRKLSNKTRVD